MTKLTGVTVSFLAAVTVGLGLAGQLASAQFQNLPDCGRECAVAAAGSNAECSADALHCLCNNNGFVDAVYACLNNCDRGDVGSTLGWLGEICAAAQPAAGGGSSSSSSSAPSSADTTSITTSTTPSPGTPTPSSTPPADGTPTTPSTTPEAGAPTTPTSSGTLTRSFTTAPPGVVAGTSTQVVVKTVGGANATGSRDGEEGEEIVLNGNGAGMGVGMGRGTVVLGAAVVVVVAGFVGGM